MTETLETTTEPTIHLHRPSRLNQAAAWVAIVAGVVFIVGAIFFSGYFLGRHAHGGGWHGKGGHERLMPMMPGMMPPPPPGMMPPPGMTPPGMPQAPGPGTPPARP